MTIRKLHSNNVTENRADIAKQYTELFFDDQTNSILLPDPTGLLELKIGANTTAPASSGVRMVGGAPNPMAPVIVTAPPGYKAANIDDGIELSLDTLAVQMATSGSRSLQFRVTTGTMSVNISAQAYYCGGNNYIGTYTSGYWNGNTLNTTWQYPIAWSFPWQGDTAIYNVQDLTNRRFYRITLSVGAGYKRNNIIMERLV